MTKFKFHSSTFLESWVVINELLISQHWVRVPIIDISWVFSSCHWVANLSKLSSIPSHPRNCESWVVLNELMFSQTWVHLQIMDRLTSSLNLLTNECMLRPWSLTSLFCRWVRFFVSVTSDSCHQGEMNWYWACVSSEWHMSRASSSLSLMLSCPYASMCEMYECLNQVSVHGLPNSALRHIAEIHRVYTVWCFLLLWTNSLLDAVAS